MRTFRNLILSCLLSLTLLAPAALAATDPGPDGLVVPEGHVFVAHAIELAGDVVVDGTIAAPPGASLLISTPGAVIVRGLVQAGDALPGGAGGDVRIDAARIVVAEGGRIVAGAGSHGNMAIVPSGLALGGNGGAGGSVLLSAADVANDGALVPGNGGRGGDAFGHVAIGGDAGAAGRAVVQGLATSFAELANHAEAPRTLADDSRTALPCAPVASGAAATPGTGADGGNACAQGTAGAGGANGADGQDDSTSIDNASRPDCPAYQAGDQSVDGEQGQSGLPGLPGGPAVATGGKGSDVATLGMYAGDGGNAVATGGNGGKGGNGGMGGHANATGNACNGGNGANGGAGGAATATGGLQGLNPVDCPKNGASGAANAYGGAGGAGGWGGAGGGGNWPWSNGASGSAGAAGPNGVGTPNVYPTLPCALPDAPSLVALNHILQCGSIRLKITAPANTGNSAILSYKVYRGLSYGSETYLTTVPYSAAVQLNTIAGQTPGTPYWFYVRAVTAVGDSAPSNHASVTPVCATSAPASAGLGAVLDDPGAALTAPTLAGSGSVGQATLLITQPATITGTPMHYLLYRGLASGSEAFLTTVPYVPGVTTYVDLGLLPSTTYWYNVTLVTTAGTSPSSNHVPIVVPLMMPGGGESGTGTARLTTFAGGKATIVQCSLVPLATTLVNVEGTFRFETQYGAGTANAREDDPKLCAAMPERSRIYGGEAARGEGCEEDALSSDGRTTWIERSCKARAGSLRILIALEPTGDGRTAMSETWREQRADGTVVELSFKGELRQGAREVTLPAL